MDDFIDTGDRVVVTEGVIKSTHARSAKPELVGEHGLVMSNDGWGRCEGQLDNGTIATLWNTLDLKREEVRDL